jgi:hypothetical protein
MARLSLPLWLLLLISVAFSLALALPASGSEIFARQDDASCPLKNQKTCGKDFPDNFCCPSNSNCISLAGDTTVMCCPSGGKCETILPIPCSLKALDPENSPGSPVKTTVDDAELPTCGKDKCCPFGYSCADGEMCVKDEDQSKPPKSDKPTTTASTVTSEPTESDSETEVPSSIEIEEPTASATGDQPVPDDDDDESEDSGPDTTAIIGGVVGACAFLLIVAVILFVCVRRRAKRMTEEQKPSTGETIQARGISGPYAQPGQYRTEFMRKDTYDTLEGRAANGNEPRASHFSDATTKRESIGLGAYIARKTSNRRPPPRASIPNRFAGSPNPSIVESRVSTVSYNDDDDDRRSIRTGRVAGSNVPPIRSMRTSDRHLRVKSRHLKPETAAWARPRRSSNSGDIDIFADPRDRETRFSDLMVEADLSELQRGKPYVPTGKTPRI